MAVKGINVLNGEGDALAGNARGDTLSLLAQVGHESGHLQYVRELGGGAYLARYDTGPLAERLGNTPEADGDGQFYRGRGLIQITGKNNYRAMEHATGLPLLDEPDLLLEQEPALRASIAWWEENVPDSMLGDVSRVTRVVNGGQIGLNHRAQLTARAYRALENS